MRDRVHIGIDFEWSNKLWTHNIFRIYELIFGRRHGIRREMSAASDGVETTFIAYTWEASCALLEMRIHSLLRTLSSVRIAIPLLRTPFGILPVPYLFAVGLDTTAASARVTTAACTLSSYVITGSNPILFAGSNVDQSSDVEQVTGVTFNLVTMSLVGGVVISTGGVGNIYLHSLTGTGGATGTHDIVSTKNGTTSGNRIFASSYSGVSQGAIDASGNAGPTAAQTNLTQVVNIVAANSWALVYNTNSVGDPTAGTNTTQRQNGTGFGVFLGDSNGAQAAGSFSMTTNRVTAVWGGIMASFAPASAGVINLLLINAG